MSYKLKVTKQFKKDVKLCHRRGLPMEELKHVMDLLVNEGKLPAKYRPHPLRGDKMGTFECHIRPDWLLLWQQDDYELIMLMTNTGTHSDLFK